jgi:DNA repair protein RadA/Sms
MNKINKSKVVFSCNQCGAQQAKWAGQCADCGAWNSLVETHVGGATASTSHYAGSLSQLVNIREVELQQQSRTYSGSSELDRVLGGGLVSGSVVLLGGDPGIGKSTLLLQSMSYLSQQHSILYATGEESLQQVALRAQRLKLDSGQLALLAENNVERILALAQQQQPGFMVIDSIQSIFTDKLNSAPGSVAQVRESAAYLVRFAKQTDTAIVIIGHVTKEGALAGPRVLEHMVDTVLYFEGQKDARLRLLRAVKNRFGAVNELGVFAMGETGLKAVTNPSAIFLSHCATKSPGSLVMVAWEGSRPLLVEVQALVDDSHSPNPRRLALGLEQNRLAMLLAVLHRHGGIASYDQDIFVNVVGGVRVLETGADLALLLAIVSSLTSRLIPADWVMFGEVGLAGEIRPVSNGQQRLQEAAKQGFKQAIVPQANVVQSTIPKGLQVSGVSHLQQAIELLPSV